MSRWCMKCGRELPVGVPDVVSETVSKCEFCSGRYASTPLARKRNFGVMWRGKKRKTRPKTGKRKGEKGRTEKNEGMR